MKLETQFTGPAWRVNTCKLRGKEVGGAAPARSTRFVCQDPLGTTQIVTHRCGFNCSIILDLYPGGLLEMGNSWKGQATRPKAQAARLLFGSLSSLLCLVNGGNLLGLMRTCEALTAPFRLILGDKPVNGKWQAPCARVQLAWVGNNQLP